MAQNESDGRNLPPVFADGYFINRRSGGDKPKYGYPPNHLPTATNIKSMEVVTGFMAALKAKA